MKKLVLHMVLVLLTVSVYSQGSYVHSDSVDSLMFKYLNMYRVSQNKELDKKISLLEEQLNRKRVVFFFFKLKQKKSRRDLLQKQIDKLYDETLKPVRMDTTYKRSCVTWAKNTSDSVVNYRVTLKHTKTYGRYSEVITGGGFGCNLNDSVSKFSVFVKKVCGKSLKDLSNVELLALASLYSWDQSKPHNEILNNPTQVKGYFSSYFQFNERSNKNNTRSYFSFSFVSIVQLKN